MRLAKFLWPHQKTLMIYTQTQLKPFFSALVKYFPHKSIVPRKKNRLYPNFCDDAYFSREMLIFLDLPRFAYLLLAFVFIINSKNE